MAPSQLSQLKAALSSAGLSRKTVSKKDRKGKKGRSQDVERAKRAAKLNDIQSRFNKFDERETKIKHDVGGRKLKGVTGRPSANKQAGLEQRRKTLLEEHNLRGHRGTFRDRRFGENDPTMTLEDRMLERYTRERQRGQGKKGLFNLEDDEGFDDEDGFGMGLTHGGRNVMDLPGDDFVAQGFGEDDDEDAGTIGRRQVARQHFGGFNDEEDDEELPERKKTKHEVMSEIIAKSKEHKLERQHQKEVDDVMRESLDEGLDELRDLLRSSAPVRPSVQLPGPARTAARLPDQNNDADYDQFVRSLVFEARAQPKDRTKTEEELAVEEKERLEEAEAKRIRRMHGEDSDEEEEKGQRNSKTERKPDADDLDDDFVGDMDEDGGVSLLGPGLTRAAIEGMAVDASDDDSDGDTTSENGSASGDDASGSGSDDDEDDDEEVLSAMEDLDSDVASEQDTDDEEAAMPKSRKVKTKTSGQAAATKEIPFTFSCPATVEEFEDILEGLDDSALPTVVQRIRALHHPSLAQGNKERLQGFLGVLMDYILILSSQSEPPFVVISALGPHLAALVKLNPLTAASHFTAKLSLMQKNLQRGISRGASNPESKTLPRTPELVMLRLVGTTWSTSDFSHPVVQPAILLIGQYLSQSRIRDVADVAAGLFLCTLITQFESQSKRIVPEAINFLASVILALLKRRKNAPVVSAYPDLLSCEIHIVDSVAHRQPVNLTSVLSASDDEQAKADLLGAALGLITSFATLYSSSEAFIEMFTPLLAVLEGSQVGKLNPALKTYFNQTATTLSKQLGFARDARTPLTLQDHKPIPIASYAPKFEDDFAPGKHYDPDAERNAAAKLRSQYKKERKGAIRELRKDNRFLAEERARQQAAKDEEYNAKMRKALGSLNTERAEEKEMEREKKREKRRRG